MSMDWDFSLAAFSEFIEGVLHVAVVRHGALEPSPAGPSGRGLPSMQPLGLLARPLDPNVGPDANPTEGAGCLIGEIGGEGWSMPTTDPRLLADVPEITKGSTLLYATKAFLYLNGETRDVTLFQRVGSAQGQSISMVATEGSEAIQVRHVSGSGIACLPDGSVLINAATASNFIEIRNDGVNISGLLKLAGGAVLGDVVGAQPLPLGVPYAAAMAAAATAFTSLAGVGALAAAAANLTAAATACTAAATGVTTKVAAS